MTRREQAAFKAGIEVAQQMALTAAVSLEVRDDGRELRQQAAAAALHGFAAGLKIAFLEPPADQAPMRRVFEAISAQDGDSGTVECPECKGRLSWARDSFNGHLHGQCETDNCLRWVQ